MICFTSGKPSLEEADNRLVLHVRDSILLNSRINVLVRTLDSDVLIILVGFFYQFQSYNNDCELTVEFGVSSNREYINIKECVNHLGVGNSLAIPFFHAFTGSDSTFFFFEKSKINLIRVWQASNNYDVLTATFQQLSWLPKECSIIAALPILQQFVIEAYGGSKTDENLDIFRLELFKSGSSNNISSEIPPSKRGLNLHIRRSTYQSGWVWGNTISQEPSPQLEDFGWKVTGSGIKLTIVWSPNMTGDLLKRITKTCSCKSVKSDSSVKPCQSCVCRRGSVSCIEQCKCKRSCVQQDSGGQ